MMPRVAIIGAGPGGLGAAMLLSRAGVPVTLFDQHREVGGRTRTIEAGNYRFDLGPTFFLYPRILEEIFAACDRNLHSEVELVRLDPMYRLLYGDGSELEVTSDPQRMAASIEQLSPEDGPNYSRYMEDTRRKFERFRPCLQRPFLSWRDTLSPSVLRLLPWLRPWQSVEGELRRYFRDSRVRLAFTFQSKYLGMSPFKCPSLFSILPYLEHDFGVYHPIGGCGEVSKAMGRVAEDLGVELRLGEPVREILFEGKRAVGLRTDAGEFQADALIVNADFARAMKKLVPNHLRRRWRDSRIAKKKFSCSTFMMYLGIEAPCDQLAHHSIYLPSDYSGILDDIETHHRLSDDPALYIQNAGVTDTTLAPRGHSTLYVLAPVTHQHANVDWSVEKARFRNLVMKRLSKLVPDLEGRIRVERIVTPAQWDLDEGIHLGATFNLAHNLGQMLHRRPRNRFEDVDGVYLTGGGTHPGSGLPVIYESARITARLLLADWNQPTAWLDPPDCPSALVSVEDER